MRAPLRLVVPPAVAAVVAVACSSGGGGMSLGAFCSAFSSANTALLSRCLGGAPSSWAEELPAQYSCSSLDAAVAAGRVIYDPTQVSSCLSGYPSLSCTELLVGPTACNGSLAGTVVDGGACLADGDCGPTSYCGGVGHGSCKGICTPELAAGATCTASEECVVGFTCGGALPTFSCISDRHPLANKGESCAAVMPTMPSIQCAPGLSCSRPAAVCATTVNEGGACTPGEALCETFTYCDSSTKTCKSYGGAGAACGTTSAGESMQCLPHLYCKPSSTKSAPGTCTVLGGGGASCTVDFECESGSCSSGASGVGTCAAPCTEQ